MKKGLSRFFSKDVKDLRKRILFTLLVLGMYCIGCGITIVWATPWLDSLYGSLGFMGIFNLMSGGGFDKFSIFGLGVTPYINASIITQLLTMDIIPYFKELKEQGYVVNDVKELVVNNNNHLVLELTDNTYNHLISFTKGNDEYIFYIDIVTTSNDIDSTILNTAEDIVRNAEYVEKVNALESMRKVDVADISLKAASEYKKATSK